MSRNPFQIVKPEKRAGYTPHMLAVLGAPGAGKSTFAASVARVWGESSLVVLDTEGRLASMGIPHIPLELKNDDDVQQRAERTLNFVRALIEMARRRDELDVTLQINDKKLSFGNPFFGSDPIVFVIDSLDMLVSRVEASVIASLNAKRRLEEYQVGYDIYTGLTTTVMDIVSQLAALAKHNVAVLLTMQLSALSERDERGVERTIYRPTLRQGIANGVLARTSANLVFEQREQPYNVLRPVSLGGVYPAKDGFGILPTELPPTWAAYVACFEGKFKYGAPEYEPVLPTRLMPPQEGEA